MTTAEIIMAVIATFTFIGGVLKGVHEFENDRADRKAFEKRIIAVLEMIQGQYAEISKQIEKRGLMASFYYAYYFYT